MMLGLCCVAVEALERHNGKNKKRKRKESACVCIACEWREFERDGMSCVMCADVQCVCVCHHMLLVPITHTNQLHTLRYMFDRASSFNQPISGWDVSKVTDMQPVCAVTGD